jgi:formate dehydrogenase beta subunit
VDICPENCIELTVLDRLQSDQPLAEELNQTYDVVIAGEKEGSPGAVMIKDEERCIRCGLCAMRCPVGCITMQGYTVSETVPL